MRSILYGRLLVATVLALASFTQAGCDKKNDSSSGGNDTPSGPKPDTVTTRKPSWFSEQDMARLRANDLNNLKQIGVAMHNHASAYQDEFPLAAICDPTGKPLLSWRVAILPFIEEQALYKQFKLDEPWDSEHNKTLIEKMPKAYLLPGSGSERDGYTHYRVFTAPMNAPGPRPIFMEPAQTKGFKVRNRFRVPTIPDGTSNTILAVETEEAIIWTKPGDLGYDDKKPLPKLGYFWNETTNALFADGSVRRINKSTNESILRLLISADDGQAIPNF